MVKSTKKIVLALLLFCVSLCVFAVNVPHLTNPVVDKANVINATEEEKLNQTLIDLNNKTGIQIGVLVIPSLEGESIESFSMKVAEDWKLGKKGEDNGALLVVSINDRKLRIETGYGLEGSLTDTQSGMIIRNVITPRFKEGNYSKGIVQGVYAMIQTVAPEFSLSTPKIDYSYSESEDYSGFGMLPFFIFILFTLISIFGSNRRRYSRNYHNNTLNTIIGAKILSDVLNSSIKSSSRGSGYGGFGGSGFGGFSGGGGGFGGGGASGSW